MQLLPRHEPAVRGFVRALVPRAADVDELMPDIALVAWRKFGELADRDAFPRWMCVIARYEVLRFRRDKARDRFVLDEAVIARLADDGLAEPSLHERQIAALEDCVAALPPARRELLLRCYRPGALIREIAPQSGHSVDGLYQLLRRIRVDLQRCIEGRLHRESAP